MSLPAPTRKRQPVARPIERRAAAEPFRWPDADVRPRACPLCGCTYLDYAPGIDAHLIVFGHRPEAAEE